VRPISADHDVRRTTADVPCQAPCHPSWYLTARLFGKGDLRCRLRRRQDSGSQHRQPRPSKHLPLHHLQSEFEPARQGPLGLVAQPDAPRLQPLAHPGEERPLGRIDAGDAQIQQFRASEAAEDHDGEDRSISRGAKRIRLAGGRLEERLQLLVGDQEALRGVLLRQPDLQERVLLHRAVIDKHPVERA
jgi:hypothetical protein